MNRNLEPGVQVDLLSQSYHEGIRKLAGNNGAIPYDFQLPEHLLEQRKKSWDNLFEKYSCNKSQVELNIVTLQPENSEKDENNGNNTKIIKNILPICKPMSVVQHWVDTGNLPYTKNCNSDTRSDTGSSLDEEYIQSNSSIHFPYPIANSNLERHSEVIETLDNQPFRVSSSSGSSINTAAYILASHNINDKVDSITIIKNFKGHKRKLSGAHNYQPINDVDSVINRVSNIDAGHKEVDKRTEKEKNLDNAIYSCKNQISDDKKDSENINIAKYKSIDKKYVENEAIQPSIVYSGDSDESIIKSKFDIYLESKASQQNQTYKFNLKKRKKLYNYTESPVELTPASEDNLSSKNYGLPRRKCEHPALQTPRLPLRQSYLARFKQIRRYRKNRNTRLLSFLQLNKSNKNKSLCLNNNNEKRFNNYDSPDRLENSWSSCHTQDDLMKDSINNNNKAIVQHYLNKKVSKEKDKITSNISQLKSFTIAIHRLPYIYLESNQEIYFEKYSNKIFNKLKDNTKKNGKSISKLNNTSLNDIELLKTVNKLFFTSSNNKTCFKSFINVQTDKNIQTLTSKIPHVPSKLAKENNNLIVSNDFIDKLKNNCTTSRLTNEILFEKSYISDEEKDHHEYLPTKALKYTVVLSSDDESNEITVKYNQRTRFVKNTEKLLKNYQMSKPLSFAINLSDQFNNPEGIELKKIESNKYVKINDKSPMKQSAEHSDLKILNSNKRCFKSIPNNDDKCSSDKIEVPLKQDRKNFQSPLVKESAIRITQNDDLQINEDMMCDVVHKKIYKKKTIFCKKSRQRSRKCITVFDDSFNKNNSLIALPNKPIDKLRLDNTELQLKKNEHFNNLEDSCDIPFKYVKMKILKKNGNSHSICKNFNKKKNAKCERINLNNLNEKVELKNNGSTKSFLDNFIKEKSKSRSYKNRKSLLITEKYSRVSVSSDEECIVPLKMYSCNT